MQTITPYSINILTYQGHTSKVNAESFSRTLWKEGVVERTSVRRGEAVEIANFSQFPPPFSMHASLIFTKNLFHQKSCQEEDKKVKKSKKENQAGRTYFLLVAALLKWILKGITRTISPDEES